MTTHPRTPERDAKRILVGRRVVLPDGRRGMILGADGDYVLVVTPGCQCHVRAERLRPDHGDPHDAGTVPF